MNDGLELEDVVDEAFRYRGYVTLILADGGERRGYVCNRNSAASPPFLQMFDEEGGGPLDVPYEDLRAIRFTGKDHAAGKSWEAWLMRREAANSKIKAGAAREPEGDA